MCIHYHELGTFPQYLKSFLIKQTTADTSERELDTT